MSRGLLAGVVSALTIAAGPVNAADTLYVHCAGAHSALTVYDGRPYWMMLGDCAGFLTAMGQWDGLRGNAKDAQSAKEIAAMLLMRSVNRYAADHKVSATVANAAVWPHVTGARRTAGQRLAQGGARVQGIYDNMGLMCQAGAAEYDRVTR